MARAVVSRLLHEPTLRLKDRELLRLPAHAARAVRARPAPRPRSRRRRGHPLGRAPPPGVIRLARAAARWRWRRRAGWPSYCDDEVELVDDHDLRRPRRARRDKSRFVKEIEEALLAGELDLAVHSAKDVPGELPDGLAIVGVPERADPRDALCGAELAGRRWRRGRVVGTASVRRRAQLLALRPRPRGARSCAATWTRGCGGWRRATSTRSCSPRAGLERLGRAGEGEPLPELVPGAGSGLPGARGAQRRRAAAAAAAALDRPRRARPR